MLSLVYEASFDFRSDDLLMELAIKVTKVLETLRE